MAYINTTTQSLIVHQDNNPTTLTVSNFPTSIAVSNFPSTTVVSNFPSTTSVSNFPSTFGVNNFPIAGVRGYFPDQIVSHSNVATKFRFGGSVTVTTANAATNIALPTEATNMILPGAQNYLICISGAASASTLSAVVGFSFNTDGGYPSITFSDANAVQSLNADGGESLIVYTGTAALTQPQEVWYQLYALGTFNARASAYAIAGAVPTIIGISFVVTVYQLGN